MKPICLITDRPISYNPRLVKEADALHEAGYGVRVVAVTTSTEKKTLDDQLMQARAWRLDALDLRRALGRSGLRWLRTGLRQKAYRASAGLRTTAHGDERAYSRYVNELAAAAAAEPADLYIAHNLQALPPAHHAARRHGAALGFDAEDFHRGQFPEDDRSLMKTLTERIEARYLPACDYTTAASRGIAEAYAEAVGIPKPTAVLNAFSLRERQGQTPPELLGREKASEDVVSLYWYSQVIGPDRGLQDVLRALPALDERVQLTLRGQWAGGFEERFRGLARQLGVEHRLRVLPPAPPNELVERAAQHDVGLALEQGRYVSRNRDACVTNKLLVYLLAGLAVVATETTGQRQICEGLPEATRLCPPGDPAALAQAIRSFLGGGHRLREAKDAAREAGTARYNWEHEKDAFLEVVERTISAAPTGRPQTSQDRQGIAG